mgnify:CR=1 FL=1
MVMEKTFEVLLYKKRLDEENTIRWNFGIFTIQTKKQTGRTMKRNDWNLKNGEYHLTVHRCHSSPRRTLLNYKKSHDKGLAPGWWKFPAVLYRQARIPKWQL